MLTGHDDFEPFVFFAKKILNRHLDIVELDVSRSWMSTTSAANLRCISIALTTCSYTRVHHLLASNAMCLQRNDEGRYTCLSWTAGSYSSRAIVGEDGIGNPLLGAIDDIPIAFALCGGCDSSNVRSSCRCLSS